MGVQERRISVDSLADVEFRDELQPGTSLLDGQYVIRDFLGADGFGITYLASDSSDRHLVIKECFPGAFCRREGALVQPRSPGHEAELKSSVRLFAEEARKLSKLSHPNIVGIHSVFEENSTAYIAMDFVNGRDLMEIIQDETDPLRPEQIRSHLERMLEAIGFVHREGMLHRDISPDNIIVRQDGEPVLIDFGAAREQATKASRILSVLRVVKDGYSPQEYYISGSEQGPSCDLYSLAATFYHVICGKLPPGSQKRLAARASGQPDPYVPLGELTEEFDAAFCAALDKAMSIMPEDRFRSAKQWAAALQPEPEPEPEIVAPTPQPGLEPRRVVLRQQLPGASAKTSDEGVSDADVPNPLSRASQPSTFEIEAPIYADPMAETRTRGGLGRLLSAGTATVVAAALGLIAYPMLSGSRDSLEVMTLGPSIGMSAVPAAVEMPRMARFAPAPRPSVPVLSAVDVEADPHGITLAIQAAPDFFGTRPLETTRVAATPPAIMPPDLPPVPEVVSPDAPQAAAPDGARDIASMPANGGALPLDVPNAAGPDLIEAPAAPETAATISPHPDAVARPSEVGEAGDQAAVPAATAPGTGVVLSSALPVLPFTANPSDPGLIGTVTADAPAWMSSGLRIVSVNGTPVETLDQATAIIAEGLAPDATEITVSLGALGLFDEAATDRTFTVPVVHDIHLPNGLELRSSFENGAWVTRVTSAPADGGLTEGDVMVGLVRTSQRTEDPEAVRQIIEAELIEDRTGLAFAVERDGIMWVETFMLPGRQE